MKNLFILIFALIPFLCNSQDFRKVEWGFTENQVKKSEPKEEWKRDGDRIGFETELAEQKVFAFFEFNQNKLYKAGYFFIGDRSDNMQYLYYYRKIDEILERKYGDGNYQAFWRDDTYEGELSKYGRAVALGDLEILHFWKNDETTISHILTKGKDFSIEHKLIYKSNNIPGPEKKEEKDKWSNF